MLADGTGGELITWNAAGVATTVAAGTAAYVLTSNGAGTAPTFQAPTGGGSNVIAISYFNLSNSSLSDSSTYLLGQMTGMVTNPNTFAHIPLPAGTITEAYIDVYNGSTFGTSENITVNFISNGGVTSDTLSSTVTADSRHQTFIVTGLSITIVAGETWISIETPVFATNPTATQWRIMIKMTL